MKLQKNTNNKYASVLFAIPSSILTSLIYDAITESSYKQTITEDNTIVIEEISQIPPFLQFTIISVSFVLLWATLVIVIPFITYLIKKMTYYKVQALTRSQTVEHYNKIKNEIIPLISQLNNDYNKIIYADEFFKYVNQLHRLFCPKNKLQQTVVSESFRKSNVKSTIDISGRISPYCYLELVNEMEKIYYDVFIKNDIVWEADKKDIENKLNDLKKVV